MLKDGDASYKPLLVVLGDWQVYLYADVDRASYFLRRFVDQFQTFIFKGSVSNAVLGSLFISSSSSLHEAGALICWPSCKYEALAGFWESIKVSYRYFYQQGSEQKTDRGSPINRIALFWSDVKATGDFLPFQALSQNHRFIALIVREWDEASHLKIFEGVFLLANQFHLERGGICLHSAAVARKKDGFLFLGPSEAGKSTVSRLSTDIGYSALGDDLNFIIPDIQDHYCLAASPSPNISALGYSNFRPLLKGIFVLVQDTQDKLVPIQPVQVARTLFREFLRETPHVQSMSSVYLRLGFQVCCNIARRVPGYELHFRKSPDFWELINEQFPD